MVTIDRACYERGCACYDTRLDSDGVKVFQIKRDNTDYDKLIQELEMSAELHLNEVNTRKYAAKAIQQLLIDNRNLRSTMIAAAELIAANWDRLTDEEGYGPVNLLNRLEKGIPAEYGYTAGAFDELQRKLNESII